MADRLRCIVPGCRRTKERAPTDFDEWVCRSHWATVPERRRRAYLRLKRRCIKFDVRLPQAARLWRSIKRGLGA